MRPTSIVIALAAGLLAAPARGADVHIGINIGVPYNYFYYGGLYYTLHDDHWFYAASFNGPWTFVTLERVPRPILAVPVRYYKVHPEHWKKHGPPPWAGHGRGHEHEHGHGHGEGHHKHDHD